VIFANSRDRDGDRMSYLRLTEKQRSVILGDVRVTELSHKSYQVWLDWFRWQANDSTES